MKTVTIEAHGCELLAQCFKYLLTKPSNNINAFVIFRRSFMLVIFETIAETTQEILYTVQITDNQTIEQYNF